MISRYSYPVTLDNGYQLLAPWEHEDKPEMVLRLFDPLYDLIVFRYVPYQKFFKQSLEEVVLDMIKELDVGNWVMRAFRRMPLAWRRELLGLVRG